MVEIGSGQLVQVALLIISGVFIFVAGHIIKDHILEPIRKYKEVVSEIDTSLSLYRSIFTVSLPPLVDSEEGRKTIKKLAARLKSPYSQIPFSGALSLIIPSIRSKKQIKASIDDLRLLSRVAGETYREDKTEIIKRVRKNLNISEL